MKSSWLANYKQLKVYYQENGNTRVPYRYEANRQLGRWVQKQRLNEEKLTSQQKKLLEQVEFVWQNDIRKEKNKNWLLMFKRLEKFKDERGHCNVSSRNESDRKLGRWVEVLRLRKDKLEDWKIRKLNDIGFKWSDIIRNEKEESWYTMYRKLETFYKKFEHSDVPEFWEEDKKLAVWVTSQRRPKKPLSRNKIRLLEDLNFSWNNEISKKKKRQRDDKGRFLSTLDISAP